MIILLRKLIFLLKNIEMETMFLVAQTKNINRELNHSFSGETGILKIYFC